MVCAGLIDIMIDVNHVIYYFMHAKIKFAQTYRLIDLRDFP